MTYHRAFDRLGNPVYRRRDTPIGHRLIQGAALVVIVVCMILLLAGGR